MKKTTKNSAAREELMAEFGTILEDIQNTVKTIAEGHGFLSNQIEGVRVELTDKIEGVHTELRDFRTETNERFTEVDKRFETMESRFESFELETRENFNAMNMRFDTVEEELRDIRRDMEELEKTLSGKEEKERFVALDVRVRRLEQSIPQKSKTRVRA